MTGVDWKESLAGWITRLEGEARSAERLLLGRTGTLLRARAGAAAPPMILDDDHRRRAGRRARLRARPHRAVRGAVGPRRHFPAEALQGLAALGCYGVAVPPSWGGAGLDTCRCR